MNNIAKDNTDSRYELAIMYWLAFPQNLWETIKAKLDDPNEMPRMIKDLKAHFTQSHIQLSLTKDELQIKADFAKRVMHDIIREHGPNLSGSAQEAFAQSSDMRSQSAYASFKANNEILRNQENLAYLKLLQEALTISETPHYEATIPLPNFMQGPR